MAMQLRTGVVDVGGGFRGIYAAGVFDYCMERHIRFDLGVGVSAGSANIASYAAGQKRRNYKFYTEYGQRREYASLRNFLKKRSFLDLDYVYGTLSNSGGEYPLDYAAIMKNPMDMIVVATVAVSGEAKYFDKGDLAQDYYEILKASSAIPFVCRPYEVYGKKYYDGALADPAPMQKAFDMGCERVVVILTKPRNEIRVPGKDIRLARGIQKNYPAAAEKLRRRADNYNAGVALARQYEGQGRALIIAPDHTCGVSTLTRDPKLLKRLYEKGLADGRAIEDFLSKA